MRLCLKLVDAGVITAEQGIQLIRQQVAGRMKLGQIAVESKLMCMGQVSDVLRSKETSSLPFGELAIEMEHLTREQLAYLIFRQQETAPSMTNLIVASGLLSEEEIQQALAQYRDKKFVPTLFSEDAMIASFG